MAAEIRHLAAVQPSRLLPGLAGLLRGELWRWLGRRGAVHFVLWSALVQGLLLWNTLGDDSNPVRDWRGFDTLIHLWWIFLPLAAIALSQNAIIEERHNDTAPWVLSKPVSRNAFVLAKVLGDLIGLFVLAILIQGVAAYVWLPEVDPAQGLPIVRPDLARFAVIIGIETLILAFFVVLSVMLSTVFRQRGPVAAIGLVAWMVAWQAPARVIRDFSFGGLVTGDFEGSEFKALTEYLVFEQPLEPLSSVAGTAVLVVALLAAATLIFRREQF
jgi:ABC-2 type transport system permease protein